MQAISSIRELPEKAKNFVQVNSKRGKKALATATLVGASLLPISDLNAQDTGSKPSVAREIDAILNGSSNADLVGRTVSAEMEFPSEVQMLVDAKIIKNNSVAKDVVDKLFSKVVLPLNRRKDSDQLRMAKSLVWLKKSGFLKNHKGYMENYLVFNFLTAQVNNQNSFGLLTHMNGALKKPSEYGYKSVVEAKNDIRLKAFGYALKYESTSSSYSDDQKLTLLVKN